MHGDGTPPRGGGPAHRITSTQHPWMLPQGTPGTPARDRKRRRRDGLIASLLARFWPPPAGNHHAIPGRPGPPPPQPAPEVWYSPAADTLADISPPRGRPYVPHGGQDHG